MLHRLRLMFVALVAALLVVGALQPTAEAATSRGLSIAAGPTAAVVKGAVVFSGKLSKSPKGSTVTIQRKSGKKWVSAKSTKTRTAAGAYSVRVTLPAAAGAYSFRAVAPKKGSLKAATSRAITVTALRKVAVTIKATPTTVDTGASTTFTGTVRPFVKNTTVTIQKLVGSKWFTATTTTLNTSGNFSKAFVVTAGAIFRASAPRVGLNSSGVSLSTAVIAKPVIATASLPGAFVGGAYSTTLTTVGGATGTWTAAPLPTGLTLNPTTGVISGTPTGAGTSQVQVGFTQQLTGLTATAKILPLQVTQPVKPTITTSSLPDGLVGTPYSVTLAAGVATGTWTAAPLPAGLALNPTTGAITGTPTTGATTPVTINFTQSGNPLPADAVILNLKVNTPKPVILTSTLPDAKIGSSYSAQLLVSGGVSGTWSVTGFPAASGLSVNASTGVISGTAFALLPTTATLTVNFTDGTTPADPVQVSLRIANTNPNHVLLTTGGRTSCRIDEDQTLMCWGAQDAGQLGNGAPPGDQGPVLKPAAISGALAGADWTSVTQSPASLLGHTHGCGIVASTAYCWGDDSSGQLGDGNNGVNRSVPGPVNGGAVWSSIVTGAEYTCGITKTGALYCWGDFDAKLGLGTANLNNRDVPERVGFDSDWSQVTTGLDATCAVKAGGTLWCWGRNVRGQVGTGDKIDKVVPTQVGAASDWESVSNAASGFTCAIKTTGTLWCWGPESNGQLANGNTLNDPNNDVLTPHQVGSATDWATISTGNGHACATTDAGQVKCWGLNSNGQLGDGSQTIRTAPVLATTATDWESVAVGGDHSCAVKTSGAVFCWGSNSAGQLGINAGPGATARSLVPVAVIG